MKILFLCVANSARSQMAEGLGKHLLKGHEVSSAGSSPTQVNPYALAAMEEIGMGIEGQSSKSVASFNLREINLVITLCAEEFCPTVPGVKKLHWPIPDPAGAGTNEKETMHAFRSARDEIRARIEKLAKELG